MEPSRAVYQIIIQPVQAVAGNDKKLFPLRRAIKQAQKASLWISSTISGPDAAKCLVKLIKQENSLLLNGLDV